MSKLTLKRTLMLVLPIIVILGVAVLVSGDSFGLHSIANGYSGSGDGCPHPH